MSGDGRRALSSDWGLVGAAAQLAACRVGALLGTAQLAASSVALVGGLVSSSSSGVGLLRDPLWLLLLLLLTRLPTGLQMRLPTRLATTLPTWLYAIDQARSLDKAWTLGGTRVQSENKENICNQTNGKYVVCFREHLQQQKRITYGSQNTHLVKQYKHNIAGQCGHTM